MRIERTKKHHIHTQTDISKSANYQKPLRDIKNSKLKLEMPGKMIAPALPNNSAVPVNHFLNTNSDLGDKKLSNVFEFGGYLPHNHGVMAG